MLRRPSLRRLLPAFATLAVAGSLLGCSSTDEDGHAADHVAEVSTVADEEPFAGRELSDPRPRPGFALTARDQARFDFAQATSGQPTLPFFGHANCPDVCPTPMADVAVDLRSVPEDVAARTQVVFVTTDPARDTAEFLGEYPARFDQDLRDRFIGLTGTQAEVETAQAAAQVPLAEGNGTMHATSLFLYGPDDVARVMFSAGDTSGDRRGPRDGRRPLSGHPTPPTSE